MADALRKIWLRRGRREAAERGENGGISPIWYEDPPVNGIPYVLGTVADEHKRKLDLAVSTLRDARLILQALNDASLDAVVPRRIVDIMEAWDDVAMGRRHQRVWGRRVMADAPKEVILPVNTADFWVMASKGGRHRYVLGTEHDRVKAQRDELLVALKDADRQLSLGITLGKGGGTHQSIQAAIAEAETDHG